MLGILSACLSALAGIYTEFLMKKNNDSLYWQNMQLYTWVSSGTILLFLLCQMNIVKHEPTLYINDIFISPDHGCFLEKQRNRREFIFVCYWIIKLNCSWFSLASKGRTCLTWTESCKGYLYFEVILANFSSQIWCNIQLGKTSLGWL